MTEKSDLLIAHIRERNHEKEIQSLQNHLLAVSAYTGEFAKKIGLEETGKILGLLHDFGKASNVFQSYILSGEGMINPDADGYIDPEAMHGKIDHSTAGAQIIYETFKEYGMEAKIAAQVMALCIASHHSGLIDCLAPDGTNNFQRRMDKPDNDTHKSEALSKLQDIEPQLAEFLSKKVVEQIYSKLRSLLSSKNDSQDTAVFKVGLLIRYLLSCLVDADRLDTADFESPGNLFVRNYGQYQPWETLVERLDVRLKKFEEKKDPNQVDILRSQVSRACCEFAAKPKGIYQLTVPTGGGKTLASLRFALNHAKYYNMDRVFYIIPYTSIIDQNADEIRKILEDKDADGHYLDRVVLEHHSNLTPDEETYRQKLLAQNWDAPVVLTTQVQFLEALFGSGTRSVRRMHQLANSVIILDEVQTLPINVIQMLNVSLRFLVENCGATVILCTATQPPLDKIEASYRALTIQSDQHIIQNEKELFERLRRVEVFDRRKEGGWDDKEIASLAEDQLHKKGSVLVVVNTKENARLLFQAISAKAIKGLNLYHLSTRMCPAHRLEILEKIKKKLDNHEPVICVSTQLIEAGVDIDFGAVIRYLAGLDSIAQSAGRCNRHGIRPGLGNVWIVNPQNENIDRLQSILIGRDQTERVLDEFIQNPAALGNDRIGIDAMAQYYRHYFFHRKDEMRYKVDASSPIGREDDLFNLLSKNTLSVAAYLRVHKERPPIAFCQSFQSAAKAFRVIDSPTRGVIVPYKSEGEDIIAELCSVPMLEKQYKLLRRAQRYSVNLFPHEFKRLCDAGAIYEVQKGAGIFYLEKQNYHKDFGLSDEISNKMDLRNI